MRYGYQLRTTFSCIVFYKGVDQGYSLTAMFKAFGEYMNGEQVVHLIGITDLGTKVLNQG